MNYPLSCNTWGEEEVKAIHRVVESGRYTMGENVKCFEQSFAAKVGSKYAVLVNSGSSANLIGLAAFLYINQHPLKPGDEVIVPAISWSTTFYPLHQHGLKLRFVDVDINTLNVDIDQLKKALTPRTRMVVGVSILGNPAPLDEIREFCDQNNLYFFEDNCESLGAELNGRQCGTFGDIGTFSTFFSHHISTMEGGLVVTDDEELYHIVLCLRAHGWTRDLPTHTKLFSKRSEDFFEAYRFILPGYNVRPTELNGAIGIEQLKKLDGMLELRRKNAQHFCEVFEGNKSFILQRENGKSSWFSFTMILNPGLDINRSRVMRAMKNADIQFRIITGGNFLRHDVIKYFDYSTSGEMKNADLAHDRGFFVGNFPFDMRREIEHLYKVLSEETS